jgi:ABC-type uncharacterized transport system fused permease/ATPase subunit
MSNKEIQDLMGKINRLDEFNKALESIDNLKDAMPYNVYREHIDTITIIYDAIYYEYAVLRKEIESTNLKKVNV